MRIGIDLGGTKIEALALADSGVELARIRKETPPKDYTALLNTIQSLIYETEESHGLARTLGFGTPGSIAPSTGRIQNSNSTCLNNQYLKEDLENLLGRPVRIANDADCFTLSEATDGVAADYDTVFGVILGTGVGGGIVINKQLVSGPNALTGEWGHNPLTVANVTPRPCYCSRSGCVESWISGPAVAADHLEQTGTKHTALEIAGLQTPAGIQTIDRFLQRLAQALGQVINILDPEAIVFGGGLSNIDRIYNELPGMIVPYIMSDTCHTKFLKAHHGDSSGVRGAAWLWP